MNTNPTVARFADRATLVVHPNALTKAEEEGESFQFSAVSNGHYVCISGNNTYVIIDTDDKVGCSCAHMTFRCTGGNVCKHIAAFLALDVPPQIPASEEIVRKLMIMGWVGGNGNLHPAEPSPAPAEPATEHYECPKCGVTVEITSDKLSEWKLNHMDVCGANVPDAPTTPSESPAPPDAPPEEEIMMIEEQTKTYMHPDGTTFPTAEELLDYVDASKESADMKEINSLVTTNDSVMTVGQQWSDGQIEVMKKTVAETATPAEFAYFMEVARCSGLNPFLREIYFMKTGKGQTAIITGRDGYLTIAKRDPRFRGIQSMDVCEKDEFEMGYSEGVMQVTKHVIKDFQDRGEIIGAWARGEMDGETPVTAYASIKEYDKGTNIWKVYKSAMIKKVPESMVLKRIAGISGLVTEAEVSDSQSFVVDTEEII